MKNTYKELIEQLRRSGQMYYPSHQSDLYFQAADAIETLLKRNRLNILKRRKRNGKN